MNVCESMPPDKNRHPTYKLMKSANILGEDLFKQGLAMEERIDAMIDRAVKRLVQVKAMEQMLASPLSTAELSSPK